MEDKNQNSGVIYPDGSNPEPFSALPVAPVPAGYGTGALTGEPLSNPDPAPPRAERLRRVLKPMLRWAVVAGIVLMFLLGLFLLLKSSRQQTARLNEVNPAASFSPQAIPLNSLGVSIPEQIQNAGQVTVNGQFQVDNGVVLTPSLQPSAPQPGQLYYDQGRNTLGYFNGTEFTFLDSSSGSGNVVEQIAGLTGQVGVGAGLRAVGGQLANSGVLSVQGQVGDVTLTGGSGITVNGTTITNTGVVSVTSANPAVVVSDDGNGNLTLGFVGGGSGTVASAGGTVGRIPVFTGSQNIEDSLINQSGLTVTVNGDLSVVTGGLSLTNALTVANGGTGTASLAANGVLVGNGTSAITSVVAGASGLCLLSTAGAPTWGACPGGSGVSSLNGLTGVLSVANASAAGSTITIDDATTASKGIASFNSTNFSVTGGAVNTAQNINTGATPTFAGLNTNSITPSSALTVGAAAQTLILQGDGGTVITATSGANTTTVGFDVPSADATINFPALAAGTYAVCTTSGNCLGGSGGGANAALSNLTGVAINTTLLPGVAGAVNLGSATLPFGDIFLAGTSGTPGTNNFRFTGASTSGTRTLTLPDASGTVCLDTGNCSGAGSGVTVSSSGTIGTLPVFTAAQTIADSLVSQSGGTVTVNGHLSLAAGNQFQINGTQISSANLSNDANLAKLGSSQTFTGNTNVFQNVINSTNAFNVQNAAGTRVLTVDTSNGEVGLGVGGTLDGRLVFSNVSNTNTITIVPGTPAGNRTITLPDDSGTVCLDTGNCAGAGATLQTSYNFSAGGITPKIKVNDTLNGVEIQDADVSIADYLLTVRASDNAGLGKVMFGVNNDGETVLQSSVNSTTALQLLTQGGTSVLTGDTQNGQTILGQGGTLAGTLALHNATNSNTITLSSAVASANQNILLPNDSGTVCLTSGNCAGVGGTGDILQGGNSFTAAMTIGTNDGFDLNLETGGVTRVTVESDGSQVTFASNLDLILQGASAYISNPQDNFANSEAFGLNASVSGANGATAVGNGAIATGSRSVALGMMANASADDAIIIGEQASATNNGSIAIGTSATAGFASIALGYGTSAGNNSAIAIGNGATTTAANQMVIGAAGYQINQVVIGNGVTNAAPAGFALQGTSGSGTDIAGAGVTIAGGQGTGTGNGGSIQFQVAKPGGTGASLNALANVLTLSGTDGSALFRNASDSTTGFQVQNAASSAILSVDTAHSQVAVNGSTVGSQGFESVTFPPASPGTWTSGGSANWARTTAAFQEGAASAASGTITDSQTSWLDLNYTFTVDGVLRFYWKVDSEDCGNVFCDGAYLLVDNDLGDYYTSYTHIAGNVNWVEVNVPVTAGAHSFRWVYFKDSGASSGLDKAWIDNVRIVEGGLAVNGALSSLGLAVNGSVAVGGNLNAGLINVGNLIVTDTVISSTVLATNDLHANDDVIVDDFLYVSGGAEYYGDVALYNGNSTTAFVAYNSSDVPQFTVDSTNSRVYIGNTTSDTTAALLVLDTKTDAEGALAGVNGGMYYNSNLGKFRCYENGSWKNCIDSLSASYAAANYWLDGGSTSSASYANMPAYKDGVGNTAVSFTKQSSSTKIAVWWTTEVWCTASCTGFNSTFAVNVAGADYECGHEWFDSTARKRIVCQTVVSGVAAGSVTVQARWSTGAGTIAGGGSGASYVDKFYMTAQETY